MACASFKNFSASSGFSWIMTSATFSIFSMLYRKGDWCAVGTGLGFGVGWVSGVGSVFAWSLSVFSIAAWICSIVCVVSTNPGQSWSSS